jgi:hypothetical protein
MSDSNFQLAIKAAIDYVKSKEIKAGLTQAQQTGCMVHALIELGIIDGDKVEDKKTAFEALYALANGSALRQKLETAEVLAKTESGRKAVDFSKFT